MGQQDIGKSSPPSPNENTPAASANQDTRRTSRVFITMDDVITPDNEVVLTSCSDELDDDEEEEEEEEETHQLSKDREFVLHLKPCALAFPCPPALGQYGCGFCVSDRGVFYSASGKAENHYKFALVVEVVPRIGKEGTFVPVNKEDLIHAEHSWGPVDGDSTRVPFTPPRVGDENVWGWWAGNGLLMKGYGYVVNVSRNVVKAAVLDSDRIDA